VSSTVFEQQVCSSKFVDMMSTRPKFLLQHILQYKASDGEVSEAPFKSFANTIGILLKKIWYLLYLTVVQL